jgi:hypothetical protein
VAITVVLQREEPLTTIIRPERFHDLGNLMLAFVMLWAYFELSQFLIIWSADLARRDVVLHPAARGRVAHLRASAHSVPLRRAVPRAPVASGESARPRGSAPSR